MEVARGEPARGHRHVGTAPSETVTPASRDSPQDRRVWCVCTGAVHTLLCPKAPWPQRPALLAHLPVPSLPGVPAGRVTACRVTNRLQAGLCSPRGGRKAVPWGGAGQSPSRLQKGGGGRGGRGASSSSSSSSPGLAVLYGFLFLCDSTAHSYRDWSRGARRGRPAEGADAERGATESRTRPGGPSCGFLPTGGGDCGTPSLL